MLLGGIDVVMSIRVQWAIAIIGLGLALFAQTPQGWLASVGAWALVAQDAALVVLLFLMLLNALLLYVEWQERFPRLPLAPINALVDDMHVLKTVMSKDVAGQEHRVQGVLATGGSTLPLLRRLLHFEPKADWIVHVLIMNPQSPWLDVMPEHWRRETTMSIQRLEILKAYLEERHKNVTLEWRLYEAPPKFRGLTIDSNELWFGFYEWDEDWNLNQQNARMLHYRKRSRGFNYFWPPFDSWFRWEWSRGATTVDLADPDEDGLSKNRSD